MVIIFPSPSGARKRAGLPNGAVAPRGLSCATWRLESSSIPSTSKGSSPARGKICFSFFFPALCPVREISKYKTLWKHTSNHIWKTLVAHYCPLNSSKTQIFKSMLTPPTCDELGCTRCCIRNAEGFWLWGRQLFQQISCKQWSTKSGIGRGHGTTHSHHAWISCFFLWCYLWHLTFHFYWLMQLKHILFLVVCRCAFQMWFLTLVAFMFGKSVNLFITMQRWAMGAYKGTTAGSLVSSVYWDLWLNTVHSDFSS